MRLDDIGGAVMATVVYVTRGDGVSHIVDVPNAPTVRGDAAPASAAEHQGAAAVSAPAFVSPGDQLAAPAQFSAPAGQQAAQVNDDTHISTGVDGTVIVRGSYADASDGSTLFDQMHYSDFGWHIVPSAENQYGDVAPTGGSGTGFEVAGDFVFQDWLFA
jgi:hypothetical protein